MNCRATGLLAWSVQRASAAYMLLFVMAVLGAMSLNPVHGYPQWRAWVASPVMTVAIAVFFASLLAHLWVGLRDVLLDYARPAGLRRFMLAAVAAVLVGMGLWVILILVRVQA